MLPSCLPSGAAGKRVEESHTPQTRADFLPSGQPRAIAAGKRVEEPHTPQTRADFLPSERSAEGKRVEEPHTPQTRTAFLPSERSALAARAFFVFLFRRVERDCSLC